MVNRPERPEIVAFLSYRREDTSGHAGRLFDALADRFGREHIFMDVTAIPAGVDFTTYVADAIQRSQALLVLIGPRWLAATTGPGSRRLDDPQDYVRLEIEAALQRNIMMIPILLQGAQMPRGSDLPPSIAALANRNALELSDARWRADVEALLSRARRTPADSPPDTGTRARPGGSRPGRAGAQGRHDPADRRVRLHRTGRAARPGVTASGDGSLLREHARRGRAPRWHDREIHR